VDTNLAPDWPAASFHDAAPPSRDAACLRLLIVTEVCFLCEALAAMLQREASVSMVKCISPAETVTQSLTAEVDAVLVDAAIREGPGMVRRLRDIAPDRPIIAYGVKETDEDVIAWAEAGATGYLPNTTPLAQLLRFVKDILRGEQPCSGQVAAALLRRIAAAGNVVAGNGPPSPARRLSRRERQVAELIAAGLSDKNIARQLNVSLATTKTHVHNLLGKLNLRHRGDVIDVLYRRRPSLRPGAAE
jgi:two-component system nitrate/nitrite response regulator NarL